MSDRRKSRKCVDCGVAICRESIRCRKCAPKVGAIPKPLCVDCGKPCVGTRCRLHNAQHLGRLRRKRPTCCPECNDPYSGPPAKCCKKCLVARQSTRHKQHDEIWALYELGLPISDIARRLGVSKNTISGYAWRQGWTRRDGDYFGPTSMDRLQALADALDAANREWDTKYAAGLLTEPTAPLKEAA